MDARGTSRRLVEVFDLFVPGTRLRPRGRRFRDDLGNRLELREYRKVFHLRFRRRGYNEAAPELGYDRNDFLPRSNAMLAEVARATSAFPAAFEPKFIQRRDDNGLLFAEGDPAEAYFSDGGILHNKPFTETLSTIFARSAERPVRRWVLSVEPDPEHYAPPPGPGDYPEVPEVVSKALMGIPRYQSIATDLESLAAHRERVDATKAMLATVDKVVGDFQQQLAGPDAAGELAALLERQVLYPAYLELRRGGLAGDLANEIVEATGAEGERPRWICQGALEFIRSLSNDDEEAIDVAFELRRIYYLLEALARLRDSLPEGEAEALRPLRGRLWAQFDTVEHLRWQLFHDPANANAAAFQALEGRRDADLARGVGERLGAVQAELAAGLAKARAEVAAVCAEADTARAAAGWSAEAVPLPFETIFDRYILWDLFILPLDRLADAGERDRVGFIRVSPSAATYVRKPPEQKVAGDTLGHFGGFARRSWRKNDILWGRLDAAEVIAQVLFETSDRAALEQAIRSVQEEIVREELPNVTGDYRTFLEDDYEVGKETIAAVSMQDRTTFVADAAAVTRNLLGRLSGADSLAAPMRAAFGWTGRGLGFGLSVTRWPVLAVFGRDPLIRRGVSLAILFVFLFAILAAVLVLVFDVAEARPRLWTLIGIAVLVFLIWSALLALGRRARRR